MGGSLPQKPDGYDDVLGGIVELLESARRATARAVNAAMTATYWEVGRRIVEFEQGGEKRAVYGQALVRGLSEDLSKRFGRGFSLSNLKSMRQFYLAWPEPPLTPGSQVASEKGQTVSGLLETRQAGFPLPWSHYVALLGVKSEDARSFYEREALAGGWSIRQLKRQIGSQFFERAALSKDKAKMLRKGELAKPDDQVSPEEEYALAGIENKMLTAASGEQVDRPPNKTGDASERAVERQTQVQSVFEQLTDGLPEERETWSDQHHGRWLLAHELEYFRREDRCAWWEFFRLQELEPEELFDERKAIMNLRFGERVGGTDKCPVHRYSFPVQEASLQEGDKLHECGSGEAVGSVEEFDQASRTLDIKKTEKTRQLHPVSVFVNERVPPRPLDTSVLALGEFVNQEGIDGPGRYRASRDLLLRKPPRLRSGRQGDLRDDGENVVDAAKRLVKELDGGVLPIQGPPGTGKTFTGGRMILELARARKRVGVTALRAVALEPSTSSRGSKRQWSSTR